MLNNIRVLQVLAAALAVVLILSLSGVTLSMQGSSARIAELESENEILTEIVVDYHTNCRRHKSPFAELVDDLVNGTIDTATLNVKRRLLRELE